VCGEAVVHGRDYTKGPRQWSYPRR
jgi:hypothetical protein